VAGGVLWCEDVAGSVVWQAPELAAAGWDLRADRFASSIRNEAIHFSSARRFYSSVCLRR